MLRSTLESRTTGLYEDLMLLAVRVSVGGMMLYGHGWKKLVGFSELSTRFHDPLGLGITTSLALATFAEFFCSILLILGLLTRFASLMIGSTMLVAGFIVHSVDPFARKELALLYLTISLVTLVKGGGRFSMDRLLS